MIKRLTAVGIVVADGGQKNRYGDGRDKAEN